MVAINGSFGSGVVIDDESIPGCVHLDVYRLGNQCRLRCGFDKPDHNWYGGGGYGR